MTSTRRDFLKIGLSGLALAGCGGGTGPVTPTGNCLQNGTTTSIQANHGHTLIVSKADVSAGVDKAYNIMGTASHTHTVTLTAAHFMMLAQNGSISVTSTTDSAHSHAVNVGCA